MSYKKIPYVYVPLKSAMIILLLLSACGGGISEDDWLYPLWIPTDIVVADIDLDGDNDILTLARVSESQSSNKGQLNVYRQLNPGVFSSPATYTVGQYPWQIVVTNINDDILPDIVITDADQNTVYLMLQDSQNSGIYLAPEPIVDGIHAYYTAVGDFNNDGASDIAINDSSSVSGRIVMMVQDPMDIGFFLPETDFFIPGYSSSFLSSDDINGDAMDDLVAWVYYLSGDYTPIGRLAFSIQQAGGVLSPITEIASQTGLNVDYLTIDDYDGNGLKDIFCFFTPFSTDYTAKLMVVLQEAPMTFGTPVDTSLSGIKGIDDAVLADLNNDDLPDFAVVGFFPEGSPSEVHSRMSIFFQSGDGKFSLAGVYSLPISASRVAAGDIDNDGLMDLVFLGSDNECMVMIQSHTMVGTFNSPKPV